MDLSFLESSTSETFFITVSFCLALERYIKGLVFILKSGAHGLDGLKQGWTDHKVKLPMY